MSVKITFSAIRSNTKNIPTAAIRVELEAYTQRFILDLASEVVKYPPPVADSRYQRTYRLLKNWRIRNISTGDGVRWSLQNSVQDPFGRYYAGLVHGPSNQLAVHASHGWKNIGVVLAEIGGRDRFRRGAQAIMTRQMGAK